MNSTRDYLQSRFLLPIISGPPSTAVVYVRRCQLYVCKPSRADVAMVVQGLLLQEVMHGDTAGPNYSVILP